MNYKELEKKVKSMTAHDIIMTMVNGLRQPRTKIDMDTFGGIRDGICYGCAATNAVLRIMDAKEEEVAQDYVRSRASFVYWAYAVWRFECAIDCLRRGWVVVYNGYAKAFGIAQITPMPGLNLPYLNNNYTEDQLQEYEKLAKYQLTVNQ